MNAEIGNEAEQFLHNSDLLCSVMALISTESFVPHNDGGINGSEYAQLPNGRL
jgi:hypothetical protein